MKLKKKMAALAFVAATGLFAGEVENVASLVDQINNAKDTKMKTELKAQLEKKLATLNEKELPKAKEIIDSKLKNN